MDARTIGSQFGFTRRGIAARLAGALLLAAIAAPALPVDAAGCGSCDDDADGLTNYEEYAIYGTDLANPNTDYDGLMDASELFVYGTDPLNADTDFDGYLDGDEISIFGTNPLIPELSTGGYGSVSWDQDMDGLGDHEEVYIFGTDPLRADSDGDGLNDGAEIWQGTSPLNPLSV
jgi:hypothetical protein